MDNKSLILWVDSLSLPAVWTMMRMRFPKPDVELRFVSQTQLGWAAFHLLRMLHLVHARVRPIKYSMGDMRSKSGESLQYECYRVSSEVTLEMVKGLRRMSVYQDLAGLVPGDKLNLLFEKQIYSMIYPLMRLMSIARWHIRHGDEPCRHLMIWPSNRLFSLLHGVWPDTGIDLVGYHSPSLFSWMRAGMKKAYHFCQDLFAALLPGRMKPVPGEGSCVATHYAEGINMKRRSDLFWYPESKIDPKRVLIYLDRSYNHPITGECLSRIESMGMRWVSLGWRRDLPFCLKSVWRPSLKKGGLLRAFLKKSDRDGRPCNREEEWLFHASVDFLRQIDYWQSFYQHFNVKIHLDPIEGGIQNVAQNIALDFVGGIRVGKQRSELFILVSDMIGYYPEHTYFSWNSRAPLYLEGDRNRNDYCIVSGFPYDTAFSGNGNHDLSFKERLNEHGGRFVIALYDNMYGDNLSYSKAAMQSFYEVFLHWVLEDKEVGLIIKSKKPKVLAGLSEVHELLQRAKETGRCIQLEDVYGRLASDAAHDADMAVGIGISSAVSEAVIVGRRGIHCDLTGLRSHPFYEWGYEKVIFDDLHRLIDALKRYRENPSLESGLGDWTSYIHDLDPFRDGKAGQRIGTYFYWFLNEIEAGVSRDEALRNVNSKYAEKWGAEKIVELNAMHN